MDSKKLLIVILSFTFVFSLYAQNQDPEMDKVISRMNQQSKAFVYVARKVTPAVVHIAATKKVPVSQDSFHRFFGPNDEFFKRFFPEFDERQLPKKRQEPRQQAAGSGVIIDARGYVLTNNHVIQDAEKIVVHLNDKRKFDAKLVGGDKQTDLAVLKIDAANLQTASFGDSEKLEVGEWVLAIGNPFGLAQTVTAGIISAKGRAYMGITEYENFIQTDAAINPGNSGGPLVNLAGEVIGINTAIVTRSGGYQGIGFAIPSNMAQNVMEQLVQNKEVKRGWLGVSVQEVDADLAKSFGMKEARGALVTDVIEAGPAEKAGMKQGDIILSLAGKEVANMNHLRHLVAASAVNQKVDVVVLRNGREITLQVVLGDKDKAQVAESQEPSASGEKKLAEWGLELQNLTDELAAKYNIKKKIGVLIADIIPGTPAEDARLMPGDLLLAINNRRVETVDQATQYLSQGNRHLLLIQKGVFSRYVVIERK